MPLSHALHRTSLWLGIIPRPKASRGRFHWTGSYRLLPPSPSPMSLQLCTTKSVHLLELMLGTKSHLTTPIFT